MQPELRVLLQVQGLPEPLTLCVHGPQDQFVSRTLEEQGVWEPYETSLVLAILCPGAVFVDVGANIGYFSVLAAQRVGARGQVFAFEPDPDNFRLLTASGELNGLSAQIHAVRAGLGDRNDTARLFLSTDNFGDHQIFGSHDARASLSIKLLNGSDYLAHRLDRLDLLKVDVQGAEYAVMAGLMPLLQAQPQVPQVLIELTPFSLRQAGSSGRQLITLLSELGQPFWIVDHIEHRLVASSAAELAHWCDQVDGVSGDQGFMNILVGSGI